MNKLHTLAGILSLSALLCSCGDEVTKVTQTTKLTGIESVGSSADLDSCAAGEMALTLDSGRVWICAEDNSWVRLQGEKGEKGEKGEQGEQGGKGEKGEQGAAGTACTAVKIEGEGVEVSCGGVVIDTLRNGNDGIRFCGETVYDASVSFCDLRDNRVYGYVVIGTRTWMSENLDFGEKASAGSHQGDATEESAGKYCYNDSSKYCEAYGGLYQWHTAMALAAEWDGKTAASQIQTPHRGICPSGWHVPDSAEWAEVAELYDDADVKLAFAGLKGGWRGLNFGNPGDFMNEAERGRWWSTAEFGGGTGARGRTLGSGSSLDLDDANRICALSLRCVRDE